MTHATPAPAAAQEHPGGAWAVRRYPLHPNGVTRLEMPGPARLLHADHQRGHLVVWVARPAADAPPRIPLEFLAVRTDHAVDLDGWTHLSTVLALGGALAIHVFWRVGTA